ncbi:transposase family protein [Oscillochloris sp. ZM17-4]|uniref:integrase catalytic domain-containing protein n=1 Tax=Oscillochloris sp. ZM17-4 TaxID=2866714 RepID=UPI001C73D78B|nr:transposase family protein [Oscillochloris sp. ZM17-4]MBX0326577.1 transposase family protein [Oscillochloris sp. ZM17-4]
MEQQTLPDASKLNVFSREDYDEAKRRFNRMSPEVQMERIHFAGLVRKYADMLYGSVGPIDEKRRLPDGARATAIAELKVKSAQSVENKARNLQRFRLGIPEDPNAYIYSVVSLAGQPPMELSKDQQAIVTGAYLFGDWEAVLPNGLTVRTRERVKIGFIFDMFRQMFPNAQHRGRLITLDMIKRCLRDQQKRQPALFKMGREGAREVWVKWMPKLPNDFRAPNECWIMDARTLPFYIRHGKRRCTVTLLCIIDAYSGFIIASHLVVRAVDDNDGEARRVDFTADDVRLLLLYAILIHRVRPQVIYTDKGSQFRFLEGFLPLLSTSPADEIVHMFGFPGHPWGRGGVEVTQREYDKALLKYAGVVRDENDLESWRRAKKAAKLSLSDLRAVASAHEERWNASAVTGKKRTRRDHFENDNPLLLPIPSFDRMLYLGSAGLCGQALIHGNETRIYDRGIHIPKRGKYKPTNLSDYRPWLDAAARGIVRYAIIPSSKGEQIYACLDGTKWSRLIPVGDDPPSRQTHIEQQWAAVRALRAEVFEFRRRFLEVLADYSCSLPRISDDDKALFEELLTDAPQLVENGKGSAGEAQNDQDTTASDHTTKPSQPRRKQSNRTAQDTQVNPQQEMRDALIAQFLAEDAARIAS